MGLNAKIGSVMVVLLCIWCVSAHQEIIIGTIIDEQGDCASYAAGVEAAIDLAVSDLNDSYAKSGLDTTVTIIKSTSNGTRESAAQAAEDLISQGARVIVGPSSSEEVSGVLPILTSTGIFSVNPSSSRALSLPGDPMVRLCPDDSNLMKAVLRYHQMNPQDSQRTMIVILAREDLYGKVLSDMFSSSEQMADPVTYPAHTRDFTQALKTLDSIVDPMIAEVGERNVTIIVVSLDETGDLLAQASAYPGLDKARWEGMDGAALHTTILENETAAAFAYKTGFTALSFNIAQPPVSDYWRVFDAVKDAKGGKVPCIYEILAYDQTLMAAWIEQNNPKNPEEMLYIADNYGKYSYAATGWLKLNENSDREFGDYYFYTVDKSEDGYYWKPVYVYKYESDTIQSLNGINNTFMERFLEK
ncbi:amino acid/amide ABC transporter substrate-binding protein, HAAT family [Methanospirillum hungatei JF-1]|uniref:Amino acid/amide ABC transporter substrate-binding protein, HAAT family n=1 Tax=Methanospirillum hungatei JF-1 (strain ATCC 27890 / DSM 864 / NBRC 100397 / JF-1) TaxID=323259 RepID=Q2FQZ4_METHJ|nr:ABC transporter substrate-binding protein [Methanospirillum hungatei]ABD41751.1 amino acid/amide ABC transporter substrate-binding protein, HAAT family [Methanospirillum hungatei JF-1]